jgi:GDPmannose 4,6-dehydratase
LVSANLLDVAAVTRLLEKVQPNEIYHLAAQSSVGLSFEQPAATIEFNVLSTINLLEAIRNMESQTRLFHPSSGDMYGKVQKLPVTEETCPRPVSPYGISKASAHYLTINYRQAHNLFACCGIMFNHESILRARRFDRIHGLEDKQRLQRKT